MGGADSRKLDSKFFSLFLVLIRDQKSDLERLIFSDGSGRKAVAGLETTPHLSQAKTYANLEQHSNFPLIFSYLSQLGLGVLSPQRRISIEVLRPEIVFLDQLLAQSSNFPLFSYILAVWA